jgi:rhamnulokinase
MSEDYLAFDLGAESGRAILGRLDEEGRLQIKELHRFPNGMIDIRGNLYWDILRLYVEMLQGMRIFATNYASPPVSIGVDTWGVDFGLLDARGNLISAPFTYRDRRTIGAMEEVFSRISRERLYQLTGIQFMQLNTVFQLYSMVRDRSPQLEMASDLLFIPDILNYFFTDTKQSEFTFATTSQLYNPRTASWESEIFEQLEIPMGIMQEIVPPGTIIGELTENISNQTGLKGIPVVATATHDTGSAVAAVPATGGNFIYISCGTWSIMGIESETPIIDEKTFEYNIANEGGICGTFRVLKDIMGLWLLQECRKEWAKNREYSYRELTELAENTAPIETVIDPDCPEFLNPVSMTQAIEGYCRATGQPVPREVGQFAHTILRSLALAYRYTLGQFEEISGQVIEQIHIIGGGSQNQLLCQFTADATGLPVYAGPAEATAIGNILVQAMAFGRISSLRELREVVRRSFNLKLYEPRRTPDWDEAYGRFSELKHLSAK